LNGATIVPQSILTWFNDCRAIPLARVWVFSAKIGTAPVQNSFGKRVCLPRMALAQGLHENRVLEPNPTTIREKLASQGPHGQRKRSAYSSKVHMAFASSQTTSSLARFRIGPLPLTIVTPISNRARSEDSALDHANWGFVFPVALDSACARDGSAASLRWQDHGERTNSASDNAVYPK